MKQKLSISKKPIPELLLLLVAIIWGSGFVVVEAALGAGLSPVSVMLGRFTVATIVFGLLFGRRILKEFEPWMLKGSLVCGALLFLAFLTQTIGQSMSTPANNAFITGSNVVMVPMLWWAVSKKRPRPVYFICSALSLLGVTILSIDTSAGLSFGVGDLLAFFAAFLFASQIVATGRFAPRIPSTTLVFLQFATAALLSLVVFLFTGESFRVYASVSSMLPVLYLGVFSTGVCYLLQTVAQRFVSSSKAAIILSTESLFGPVFSVLFGYDLLSPRMLVGGSIMLVSILLPEIWLAHTATKNGSAAK